VAREKAVVVSAAKAACEVLVKQIVQDKRAADEQERVVNAEAEKIGNEAADANEIARVVQGELDKALPALQAAEDALNVLTKKDISELKAYAKPPGLVELTLQGARRWCGVPAAAYQNEMVNTSQDCPRWLWQRKALTCTSHLVAQLSKLQMTNSVGSAFGKPF
jgi:Microtubule-binding stalk of dynein motor